MRARLIRAFDQFYDVRLQSDLDVARLLYRLEVDIVVDLNATPGRTPAILSIALCPLQVNYLGTRHTGPNLLIYHCRKYVLPSIKRRFHREHVHLPDCYQANDSKRTIRLQLRHGRNWIT